MGQRLLFFRLLFNNESAIDKKMIQISATANFYNPWIPTQNN